LGPKEGCYSGRILWWATITNDGVSIAKKSSLKTKLKHGSKIVKQVAEKANEVAEMEQQQLHYSSDFNKGRAKKRNSRTILLQLKEVLKNQLRWLLMSLKKCQKRLIQKKICSSSYNFC
jgi:hypothetical protein